MIANRPNLKALTLLASMTGALAGAGPAAAQEVRPPRWTAALEFGAQFPTTMYDERVTARTRLVETDSTFSLSTQYSERIDVLPIVRALFRYKPESDFGAFLSVQHGAAGTTANYVGGESAPETLFRNVRIWAFEAGLSVILGRWSNGQGLFEYSFAPTFMRHSLDLSNGHRDVFAHAMGAPRDEQLTWTRRQWNSWGLGLGAGARFPIRDPLALRVSVQTHIVGVGTSQIEHQEREEVRRLSGGRTPVFLYSNYTAHYPAARIGFEYVISRQAVRPLPTVALPRPARPAEPSAESRDAVAQLAQGDTTSALALLRQRVADEPEDGSAWRELALILAARTELGPAARDEAWQALQRAVHANPGDDRVLSAYGRVRALMQRAGEVRAEAPPLSISTVNARADAAGVLSIAWTVQNLAEGEAGMRYRVVVQVIDDQGIPIPLQAPEDAQGQVDIFQVDRTASQQPVIERLELRLTRARAGPHSVRVRVTDLETGQSVDRVAGFEIR